jgi:hypothetical protein
VESALSQKRNEKRRDEERNTKGIQQQKKKRGLKREHTGFSRETGDYKPTVINSNTVLCV